MKDDHSLDALRYLTYNSFRDDEIKFIYDEINGQGFRIVAQMPTGPPVTGQNLCTVCLLPFNQCICFGGRGLRGMAVPQPPPNPSQCSGRLVGSCSWITDLSNNREVCQYCRVVRKYQPSNAFPQILPQTPPVLCLHNHSAGNCTLCPGGLPGLLPDYGCGGSKRSSQISHVWKIIAQDSALCAVCGGTFTMARGYMLSQLGESEEKKEETLPLRDGNACTCPDLLSGHHNDCLYPKRKE